MRRALAFALLPLVLAQVSAAEECFCPDTPIEVRAAEADYVFEVRARGTGDLCDGNIYREGEKPWLTQVEVLDARNGDPSDAPLEFLRHDEAPTFCGVKFTSGKRYLVFGEIDARGFHLTDACSVTLLQEHE